MPANFRLRDGAGNVIEPDTSQRSFVESLSGAPRREPRLRHPARVAQVMSIVGRQAMRGMQTSTDL